MLLSLDPNANLDISYGAKYDIFYYINAFL